MRDSFLLRIMNKAVVNICTFLIILSLLFWRAEAFQGNTGATRRIQVKSSMSFIRFPNLFPELSGPSTATEEIFGLNELEKEVSASVRAKLDQIHVEEALSSDDLIISQEKRLGPQRTAIMASPWQISLAAASAVSTFVLVTTNASLTITGIVFVVVFFIANGDPLDEDNATGAVARQVGRMTIQSVESSKPRLKAIARAVITDQEEIVLLKKQIRELRKDNAKLQLWKERRMAVDDNLSRYSLDELKDVARTNRLAVGGTKSQLMMRILENDVDLDLT